MMLASFRRRSAKLIEDPVLRRWLKGRLVGLWDRPSEFVPHRPPYLTETGEGEAKSAVDLSFPPFRSDVPTAPLTLALPGETITLSPDAPGTLFERHFDDTETLLAAHRFAWLPLMATAAPPGWVDALWRAWVSQFGDPDDSWAWHPYTAAERAINILSFARVNGLPGSANATLAVLAKHGTAITERLEYFGDQNTGNHLSNNGRGLYLLGLALGNETMADRGGRLLIKEADRIFASSGVLREGSTHYHLLLTRNYTSAWLAALRHRRKEEAALETITRNALQALLPLSLPGGLPLIGDISPDCPPEFLAGLIPGESLEGGWSGQLSPDETSALAALKAQCVAPSTGQMQQDGWIRYDSGPWSSLWHAPPDGWVPMPGHGHQDLASFELHYKETPLFIDTGRGAYGEEGEAAYFVSAKAHNTVTIDDKDPYPPNKPYYTVAFRRRVAGQAHITRVRDGVTLSHGGFRRLRSMGEMARHVVFADGKLTITDRIEGKGIHRVTRRFHTTLPVRQDGDGVVIEGIEGGIRLTADGPVKTEKTKCWTAYGVSEPANVIEISVTATLPIRLQMTLTVKEAG